MHIIRHAHRYINNTLTNIIHITNVNIMYNYSVRYVYHTVIFGGVKRFGDDCRSVCLTLLRIGTTATPKFTTII